MFTDDVVKSLKRNVLIKTNRQSIIYYLLSQIAIVYGPGPIFSTGFTGSYIIQTIDFMNRPVRI